MSTEQLIRNHLEQCKDCKEKCDGIHITIDNKTRCDRDESKG